MKKKILNLNHTKLLKWQWLNVNATYKNAHHNCWINSPMKPIPTTYCTHLVKIGKGRLSASLGFAKNKNWCQCATYHTPCRSHIDTHNRQLPNSIKLWLTLRARHKPANERPTSVKLQMNLNLDIENKLEEKRNQNFAVVTKVASHKLWDRHLRENL